MELNYMQKRTWAEVDLDALEYNYEMLKNRVPKTAKICCVVKADAYGHGSVRVAKLYEELGADFFAVSNIKEALTIRNAGIKQPILILGYTHPSCAKILAQNRISQCVYSYDYGKELAKEANASGVRISIHIKVDVGMGRLGFIFRTEEDVSYKEVLELCKMPGLYTEGIFTHFPVSGEVDGSEETKIQYDHFKKITEKLEECGARFIVKHCCNSAAASNYPEYSMDMVRLGISLYGITVPKGGYDLQLKNTMTLKTVVCNIKEVKRGEPIGYGSEYVAESDIKVATLPIGYADGFKRENWTNGTRLWMNGESCLITGRICMDQTMIDVTNLKNVRLGDEVVIYGKNCGATLNDFAENNGRIPYEIMCEVGPRVPRVYIREEKIDSVRDSLT